MNAGGLGGRNHGVRLRLRLEAGDVLGDGAGEELNVLRQVADMFSERLRRPLTECRPVEAHLASESWPDADEEPGEG